MKKAVVIILVSVLVVVIVVAIALGVYFGLKHHKNKTTTTPATTTPWNYNLTTVQPPPPAPSNQATAYQNAANYLKANVKQSVDPCDSFYDYACGNYKTTQAADRYWGNLNQASITILNNAVTALGNLSVTAATPVPIQYLQSLYQMCGDTQRLSKSLSAITAIIKQSLGDTDVLNSGAAPPHNQWKNIFTLSRLSKTSAYVSVQVGVDFYDKSKYALLIDVQPPQYVSEFNTFTGGLLGYAKVANIRNYHNGSTFDGVLRLSNLIKKNVKQSNSYFSTTLSKIESGSAQFAAALLDAIPTAATSKIWISPHPSYLSYFDDAFANNDVGYYAQAAIVGMFLGQYFDSNGFKTALTPKFHVMGNEFRLDTQDDVKNCVQDLFFDGNHPFLAWAMTRVITDKFGPHPADVKKLSTLVTGLINSFRDRIKAQTWLDSSSMNTAVDKLNAIQPRLVYPSWLQNDSSLNSFYSTLKPIKSTLNFVEICTRVYFDHFEELVATLSKSPYPKADNWAVTGMSTLITNAYYQPGDNTINILLGILQGPFYDTTFPPALIYGIMGSIVGHELTHGFDASGVYYDKTGVHVPSSWLSASSKARFQAKTNCFVNQFSQYCYPNYDGVCVNGTQTISENIADRGGVDISYHAYTAALTSTPQYDMPGLETLTTDQLFMVSYATVWCTHLTKDGLIARIKGDVHSPGPSRVNGTLQDTLQFSYAYGCDPGTKMHPYSSCALW